MKKIIYVLLTIAMVFCFASCKDEVNVKQLPDYVSNNDFAKAKAIIRGITDKTTCDYSVSELESEDCDDNDCIIKNFVATKSTIIVSGSLKDIMTVNYTVDYVDSALEDLVVEATFEADVSRIDYYINHYYGDFITINGEELTFDATNETIKAVISVLDIPALESIDDYLSTVTENASVRVYTLNEDYTSKLGYGLIAKGSKLTLTQTKSIASKGKRYNTVDGYDLTIEIDAVVMTKPYKVTVSTLSDYITINGVAYRYENQMFNELLFGGRD